MYIIGLAVAFTLIVERVTNNELWVCVSNCGVI